MVTDVEDATATVDTVKLALSEPAGIETLAGTDATDGLLLVSEMTAPPDGARLDNRAVPCDDAPPTTLVGFSESDARVTGGRGFTINVAFLDTPA
jgi:hypothetical protein